MSLGKAGSFELIELLGEGGVGQVYSARDPLLGRQVAVKMLRRELSSDREFLDRFYGEAQRLGDLNHANITTLYGLYFEGDEPFMAMELVRGRTLKALRQRAGRLPPRESLAVMAQTLAGLAYAHRAGVIHRDVKPANLMVTDSGIVKIMDFGIARVRGSMHMTRAGQIFLTPLYASPEQIKGEEVDERSDLYSLGVVFYEMLAGRPPFTARSEYLLEKAHLEEPPPPLTEAAPDLDPRIEAAVMRALAKNPEDRFATADAFASAVDARAIRGDAPELLQEFIAAAFRESTPDETRQLDRASGSRGQSSPMSRPRESAATEIGIEARRVSQSRAEAPSFEGAGLRVGAEREPGLDPGTGAADEPASRARRLSPAWSEPARMDSGSAPAGHPGTASSVAISKRDVAARAEDRLSASWPKPHPRPRVSGRIALLGGAAVAVAVGIGYAGIRSWSPVFFDRLAAPRPVAAEQPLRRPDKAPLRPFAMFPTKPHGAHEGPPNRTPTSARFSPAPPPHGAAPRAPEKLASSPQPAPAGRPNAKPPADGAPAPPHGAAPRAPEKLASSPQTAPAAPNAKPPASATPAPAPRRAAPRSPERLASSPQTAPPAPPPAKPLADVAPAPPRVAPRPSKEPAASLRVASVAPSNAAPPIGPAPTSRLPALRPKPDLEGIVAGAMSASMIKVGGHWIELYGIDDPTRQLRRHIEAVEGYLVPARGRVACYRKTSGRYQCYSGGQDLALLALRDGIARPARDAPDPYREAALRRAPRRTQP